MPDTPGPRPPRAAAARGRAPATQRATNAAVALGSLPPLAPTERGRQQKNGQNNQRRENQREKKRHEESATAIDATDGGQGAQHHVENYLKQALALISSSSLRRSGAIAGDGKPALFMNWRGRPHFRRAWPALPRRAPFSRANPTSLSALLRTRGSPAG